MSDVVNKLWAYCHSLRHDGIGYTDYVEQISFLLFLKIADEKGVVMPQGQDWPALSALSGQELLDGYADMIRLLGREAGVVGTIFADGQSRFTKPASLKTLIQMIDAVTWTEIDVDVKGATFEGLLERTASEGKKGAGQYFTPRPLIRAIVDCVQPDLTESDEYRVHDPALGTGGFLLAAAEWMWEKHGAGLDRDVQRRMRDGAYSGSDSTALARRLAMMNLYLHEMGGHVALRDSIYDPDPGERYDCVLTNPPFGVRGASSAPEREDFTVETSNKQLNFLQHILTILKPGGRCGVVLPDNVLFQSHAAPEVVEILTRDCNLHTVLRLPRGTFSPYSQGVKANVFFFQKGLPTEMVWVYDLRSGIPGFTKKERPLTADVFREFVEAHGARSDGRSARTESERFRPFAIDEIRGRNFNLDVRWLQDDESGLDGDLPEPDVLATEIRERLREALDAVQRLEAQFSPAGATPNS